MEKTSSCLTNLSLSDEPGKKAEGTERESAMREHMESWGRCSVVGFSLMVTLPGEWGCKWGLGVRLEYQKELALRVGDNDEGLLRLVHVDQHLSRSFSRAVLRLRRGRGRSGPLWTIVYCRGIRGGGAEIQPALSSPSPVPWSAKGSYKVTTGVSSGPGEREGLGWGLELEFQERKKVWGSGVGRAAFQYLI